MLSILIPIYNCNVVKLVDTLHKQCRKEKITFEILCFDDGSDLETRKENAPLAAYFGVNYTELSRNLGRARIRNWLAKSASYDNLLFLDCDSKVSGRKFVRNYIDVIGKHKIVSGGRNYSKSPPRAKSKKLHWLYGTHRESKSAAFRNKHPYLFFHSNNFLVEQQIFKSVFFNEEIEGYGYEDLLWAERVKGENLEIHHIDNPVQHLGLEKNTVFLAKTRESIDNLLRLKYRSSPLGTRLEKAAQLLLDNGFHEDFMKIYKYREDAIEKNILSANPRIKNLDYYKLNYYLSQRAKWVQGDLN
ncbi:MAG: glycosyltransferase family 2 protein [Bacteroidia bacterium]|nr:glycosyltransferase family 2 protein [Bacteroidia bacterium]